MGTALNARHVQHIRRFVPRVVLVFDADAGGDTGVDRALEIFASHEMDLAIATLPVGLDPCDLLLQEGAAAFRRVLEAAVDALEYKLAGASAREDATGVEGRRRVVDAVLGVISLAPTLPGEAGAVKMQLMINRIARRLALKEETVWARLDELRKQRRGSEAARPQDRFGRPGGGQSPDPPAEGPRRAAPAAAEERQLLEVLLAEPGLVARAVAGVGVEEIEHPGLRRLLHGLYALHAAGEPATLDRLRADLDDMRLMGKAFELQEVGLDHPNREAWLGDLLAYFRQRRARTVKQELQSQLHAASDHAAARKLLERLQNRSSELGPDTACRGDCPNVPLSPME
jgi:DNA primase